MCSREGRHVKSIIRHHQLAYSPPTERNEASVDEKTKPAGRRGEWLAQDVSARIALRVAGVCTVSVFFTRLHSLRLILRLKLTRSLSVSTHRGSRQKKEAKHA